MSDSTGSTPSLPFSPATAGAFARSLAARFGDRTALVLGDRRVSYAELEAASAKLARGLVATGVGKGTRVALLMQNGPDWVAAWLAAARIGALVVPLNTFYKAREIAWALRHSDARVLLVQHRYLSHDYLERLEECCPGLSGAGGPPLFLPDLPHLREVRVWGEHERAWALDGPVGLAAAAETVDDDFLRAIEASVHPADPMLVIYSSGSSADPKGAIHSQGTVIRHPAALNAFRTIGPDDVMYSPMPFFWVGGLVFSLLGAMHAGARLLCEDAFDAERTLDLIERERTTIAVGWPHYAKAMAEHPSFGDRDLSSLREGNLYAILPQGIRPDDPELRSNALGMTETCGPHTIDRMDVDLPEEMRGAFGHSVPGLRHKAVDPETGDEVAEGEVGEICVRGPSVMQGLYKVEREQVFDDDGYYHTGDGGRFDGDGVLFFAGRLGDVIKTGGANVTPREIEVVLEAFEEVKEAYVVGVPDPDRGQLVVAALVLQAGAAVEPDDLRLRTKAELSAYKVPRAFFVYAHDDLPFTDSGKIDKRTLTRVLAERLAG